MRASIAGLTGLAGLTRLASLTSLAGLTRLARLAGTSANGVRALCGASLTGTRDAYPRGGSRWPHARRAETNVEVELVDRLRAPRRNVVDCGIAIDADPRSFQAGKWRLISGHRLRMQDVRDQELGVIVKPGGQIETLIALPVAVARQPDQFDNPLGRLGWIGLEPTETLRGELRAIGGLAPRLQNPRAGSG
jgi:hypothetical protein